MSGKCKDLTEACERNKSVFMLKAGRRVNVKTDAKVDTLLFDEQAPHSDVLRTGEIHRIQDAAALDIYSQQLARFGLLEAEQERKLGIRLNAALAALLRELMRSDDGLSRLEEVLDEFLLLHEGRNSLAEKKWAFQVAPDYARNLVFTLADSVRVMRAMSKPPADVIDTLCWNLAWLVCSLAVGRHQLVELLQDRALFSDVPFPEKRLAYYFRLRNQLVEQNLRLVYQVAMKFRYTGVLLEDLIQEGNVGLIIATDRFNFHRGYRFSTYAVLCIQNVIKTALQKRYHLIARPSYLQEKLAAIRQAENKHYQLHASPAPLDWLSKETDIPLPMLERIRTFPETAQSLNQPLRSGESDTLMPEIADDSRSVLSRVSQDELLHWLQSGKTPLSDKEVLVVRMRFGLGCPRDYTLREVADQLRVSVERARQLQKSGLQKLTGALKGFNPDLL